MLILLILQEFFKFTNKYNNELNLRNGRVIEVVKDTVTKNL